MARLEIPGVNPKATMTGEAPPGVDIYLDLAYYRRQDHGTSE